MGLPPTLSATHRMLRRGRVMVVVREDWREALPVEEMLAGAPLWRWGRAVEHGLRGRGPVHVLATTRGEIVAKQLTRGGIIGAFARRTYFDPWRPVREADLAEQLRQRGCPTPPVVALRATRTWPGMYRLELATARVPNGRDLLDVLQGGGDLGVLAAAAGATVRRLHDAGLRHRDLQLKNLLVPAAGLGAGELAGRLVVLDLDRCSLGPTLDASERLASLVRLGRSAVKNGLLGARGPDSPGPWWARAFFVAYGAGNGRSPACWLRDVARRLRQRVATHRMLWKGGGKQAPSAH